jgi:MFS family permease
LIQLIRKRNTLFYGWWVVGACFVISFCTSGVFIFSLTALYKPLATQFGWSYTQISLAASLQGLLGGLTAPLVGFIVDRWGSRKLIFGVVILGCAGLVLLSRATTLGMFYTAFILISLGYSACSGTAMLAAVITWFHQNTAMAIGIVVSGFALGGLLVPLVVFLIDTFGWQTAMISLGLFMLAILLPISLLVRHNYREKNDFVSDVSENAVPAKKGLTAHKSPADNTAVEALKSRAFWHISLALMFQFIIINTVLVHIIPYLSSIGITRANSSLVASALAITNVCGRLLFGWFGDRFEKRRVIGVSFALTTLGLLFYGYAAGGTLPLILFIILFGMGWGGQFTMMSPCSAIILEGADLAQFMASPTA